MGKPSVGIVGAGPGGLACAMLLASRGVQVTVFEKGAEVGGRNAPIKSEGFTFDTGPTFLMMPFILEDMFRLAGRDAKDYLELVKIEPMYHLYLGDWVFSPTSDHGEMRRKIRSEFPGNESGLSRFYRREKERYRMLAPCLQKDYSSFLAFLSPAFIAAIPHFFTRKPLFGNLGNYFNDERLRLCFTFQAKYLGMSPWECPGVFTIIPFIEHEYGIYHVMGGLNRISLAMEKVVRELGGEVLKGKKIRRLVLEGKAVRGVELEGGKTRLFDDVVLNADFAYSMSSLIGPSARKRYSDAKLGNMRYSCSTFMLYLGLDRRYDIPHHNIYLAKDYRENIDDIAVRKTLSDDMSFYVQNPCVTDPSLAPRGKSAVYVLVPVPNNSSKIDWEAIRKDYADRVLAQIESRTSMKDIRKHIVMMKTITPLEWERQYNVYLGATFNLAHNISQMLYFRPHNRFEELDNCFIVGGGTHPGSGLPTILESGRISADLILKKHGLRGIAPSAIPGL